MDPPAEASPSASPLRFSGTGQNEANRVNHRPAQRHPPRAKFIGHGASEGLAHPPNQIVQRNRRAIGKGRNGVLCPQRQQKQPKGLPRPKR